MKWKIDDEYTLQELMGELYSEIVAKYSAFPRALSLFGANIGLR